MGGGGGRGTFNRLYMCKYNKDTFDTALFITRGGVAVVALGNGIP